MSAGNKGGPCGEAMVGNFCPESDGIDEPSILPGGSGAAVPDFFKNGSVGDDGAARRKTTGQQCQTGEPQCHHGGKGVAAPSSAKPSAPERPVR